MNNTVATREAIIKALPIDTEAVPEPAHLYIPPAHIKALRPECYIVVGARGVGKSVWTAALGDAHLRKALGTDLPELEQTEVRIGFSQTPRISNYPDAASFGQLLNQGVAAYDVWRAVVLRWIADLIAIELPRTTWRDIAEWVQDHPEQVAAYMQQADQHLGEKVGDGLIVFDALDRLSQSWEQMDDIVRDLLRTALWLKPFSHLSAKIFLREDQFERTVTDFPDASKLLATHAELSWAAHDLHGLLWQHLLNAPGQHGQHLRQTYERVLGTSPREVDGRWILARDAKRDTPTQRALFTALAGEWMGRDRRRGVPYIGSVNHLADGKGRTSPRSFLAAIRQAAEDSLERYPDHPYALHYESIKRGVQKASEIRVNELAEDYPWVKTFMSPLHGLSVPCDYVTIRERWQNDHPHGLQGLPPDRLPPQHIDRGWDGVKDDLIRLGIFDIRNDGRIDMPDLYRVGFGLGRRGGVKPRR